MPKLQLTTFGAFEREAATISMTTSAYMYSPQPTNHLSTLSLSPAQTIPFGQFWRLKQIGQLRVSVSVETSALTTSCDLTLSIQQVGSKVTHKVDFSLP